MSRLTWKLLGGVVPFVATICTAYSVPHYTIPILGLAIIWANAVGFIEGHLRSVGPR